MTDNTNNKLSNQENLEKFLKMIEKINQCALQPISPELKETLESPRQMFEISDEPFENSNFLLELYDIVNSNKTAQVLKGLSERIKEFNCLFSFGIPQKVKDNSILLKAISHLHEENWPYFLFVTNENAKYILACEEQDLKIYLYSQCNKEFISDLLSSWKQNSSLKEERKQILCESCECYLDGKYGACVSVFACQFDGLIDDINYYIQENNVLFDSKEFECLYYEFCPNVNKNSKKVTEKNKFIKAISTIDEGCMIWWTCCDYVINEVYSNNPDYSKMNPNRNKICHGEQLNISNKEHALKSILLADMLIKLKTKIEKANLRLCDKYSDE